MHKQHSKLQNSKFLSHEDILEVNCAWGSGLRAAYLSGFVLAARLKGIWHNRQFVTQDRNKSCGRKQADSPFRKSSDNLSCLSRDKAYHKLVNGVLDARVLKSLRPSRWQCGLRPCGAATLTLYPDTVTPLQMTSHVLSC